MREYSLNSSKGKRWLPWFRDIFEEGRNLPSEHPAELLLVLASGKADALSVVSSHPTTISTRSSVWRRRSRGRPGRERSSALQDHRDEVSAQLAQLACRHGQNIFAVNPHFAVDPRLTRQQPHQGPQAHAFARAASPRMHSILASRALLHLRFGERYEGRLIHREFAH